MMETLLARLTPPGKAAIATIAVHGPQAWSITRELFTPGLPEQPLVDKCWFGRLGTDSRDEVVLAARAVDHVEIHCHGGVEVVRMIQECYEARGGRVVPWQELPTRDGRDPRLLDLLSRAPTTRTASILLDQWLGATRTPRWRELESLGRHLIEPWKVVIAGAPNVGKSSLMNALAGFTRSIVSPIAGTTRDVVTTPLAIDGWPIEMVDTAGLRLRASGLEQQGIERARQAIAAADLRWWVLDGSAPPHLPEDSAGWRFVVNKIDLPAAWDWSAVEAVRVSAVTRAGLEEWCERIAQALVPTRPEPGEAVPCLPEHFE